MGRKGDSIILIISCLFGYPVNKWYVVEERRVKNSVPHTGGDEPFGKVCHPCHHNVFPTSVGMNRCFDRYVNYPPLTQGASCFIPLPIGSESTGSSARSAPA